MALTSMMGLFMALGGYIWLTLEACAAHPERFVRGDPQACALAEAVWNAPPMPPSRQQPKNTLKNPDEKVSHLR